MTQFENYQYILNKIKILKIKVNKNNRSSSLTGVRGEWQPISMRGKATPQPPCFVLNGI